MYCTVACDLLDFFFFEQKTAYDMRISDWSSDVCSSDLPHAHVGDDHGGGAHPRRHGRAAQAHDPLRLGGGRRTGVARQDRKSVVKGKSVSVRVDLGGRGICKTITIAVIYSPVSNQRVASRR